jgi:hypothetical protein
MDVTADAVRVLVRSITVMAVMASVIVIVAGATMTSVRVRVT